MIEKSEPGYSRAAQAYWDKGWRGILPLKPGTKWPPPTGYTGYAGSDPSFADITAWSDDFIDGNLCLRLPAGVVGIDIDAYGAKTGAATLEEAQRRWGELPDGPRTTSRDDGVSGIRMFRVDESVLLEDKVSFPELSIGDIEVIQRHHRYAVCWPSIHPETGRGYWWTNASGQLIGIPRLDDLPELPAGWVEMLSITRRKLMLSTDPDIDTDFDVRTALTGGAPTEQVSARLASAVRELNLPGASRHDTCCGHVMALARLGMGGHSGVDYAMQQLRRVFVAVVTLDGSRTVEVATSEFNRMVTNTNLARELAQPGITDWMLRILEQSESPGVDGANANRADAGAIPLQPDADGERTGPEDERDDPIRITPNRPGAAASLEAMEDDFWTVRTSHQLIYAAALNRMASPWAVMACCVARILCMVPPSVVLPPLIGGIGSLNWFAAIAAKSGGGKGAAMTAARDLIPGDILVYGIGSGEGMIECYNRARKKNDDSEPVVAVLFSAEEIDSLGAMGGRSGQTTMPILRQGFSGEALGFSYRGRAGERVAAHSYRMTVVAAVQPERAGVLLEDSGGGTPQRFMWFPGRDRRIVANPPAWPTDDLGRYRSVPVLSQWNLAQAAGSVEVPDELATEVRAARAASMMGDDNAMDSHVLFCREKFAFGLACLDGRTVIDSEDWRLAGIATDVSSWTRDKATEGYRAGKEAISREQGHQRALAADEQKLSEEKAFGDHVQRLVWWVIRKLDERGPMTQGDLYRAANSRDRPRVGNAVVIAAEWGLVLLRDGKYRPSPEGLRRLGDQPL